MSNFHGKLCRICLQSGEQLHSLSFTNVSVVDEYSTKSTNQGSVALFEIYEQFTRLTYDQSNWEWVCNNCYTKLVEFHHFRQLCIESWGKLSAVPNFKSEVIDIGPSDVCTVEIIENDALIKTNYDSESNHSYDHLGECDDSESDDSDLPIKPAVSNIFSFIFWKPRTQFR